MTNVVVVKINEPGHFILSDRCQYFMHHHAGDYCISTVGELVNEPEVQAIARKYTPWAINEKGWQALGPLDGFYEIMVFKIREELRCDIEECNCPHGDTGGEGEVLQWRFDTKDETERAHQSIIDSIVETGSPPYEPGILTTFFKVMFEDD